jgi:gamma-glutamyltranspeptidase / glutathione hydrolase
VVSAVIERHEITVRSGAVATESAVATGIGARILELGGNAMDAAAAACLADAVTMPYFVDLGGYVCAATVLDASGRVWSIDANAIAPAAARSDMFTTRPPEPGKVGINENEYECSVDGDANIYGPLAVAPPGFVAGVGTLWERWGRLRWEQIVAGSVDLIERGFPFADTAPAVEKRLPVIAQYAPTRELLLPDGKTPHADQIWHRSDLATTLLRLAKAGWRDFYEGEIGRRIGDYVEATGGVMTRADMAAFQPRVTPALESSYRHASVYGPLLPNGALTVLQILNMLEAFDPVPQDRPLYWHRLAEILKLAWSDRLEYLADPDFADVPASRLLGKRYAAERVDLLRRWPDRIGRPGAPLPSASRHGTAHVSAADAEGNVVSVTISQGNPFGSCVTVPGTGFILGHAMCRFDPRPGRRNSIAPGKRPLNNVCPMIVRTRDRDVAVGMRGGRRIVSVVAQMAHRIVDHGMSPLEASTSIRIHTLADEPIEYEKGAPVPFEAELTRMGHQFRSVDELGGSAHCAEIDRASRSIRAGGSISAAGL